MTAVTQRAIYCEFACPRSKDFHDLGKHDWSMRAGGVLPPAITLATSPA